MAGSIEFGSGWKEWETFREKIGEKRRGSDLYEGLWEASILL